VDDIAVIVTIKARPLARNLANGLLSFLLSLPGSGVPDGVKVDFITILY